MKTYHSPRNGMPYTGNDPQLMCELDPSSENWDQARAELGPWSSDAQIERRALELAHEATQADERMAEDDEAESRLDDRNDY